MRVRPIKENEADDTVAKVFWQRVSELGKKVALRDKDYGIWQPITWTDYGAKARAVGLALLELGLSEGGRAAIVSDVCPEWLFADLGIIGVGGISFGIYPTDAPAQVEYIMDDSGAEFYFAENEEQLDKILETRDRLPELKKIIVFDMKGLDQFQDPMVMSFDELVGIGQAVHKAHPHLWEEAVAQTQPEDVAILVYTSGTTGPPKGAMLTHANITFQMRQFQRLLPHSPEDRSLAFLPLCHIAERAFTTFNHLVYGHEVHFVENFDTVPENLREVQPTAFFAVPRIWERFFSQISIQMKDATRLEQLAYNWALGIGYKRADKVIAGKPVGWALNARFRLAEFLVLGNVKRMLGLNHCQYTLTGAAPISPELIRWYFALGIYMAEVYGQTENTGVATLPVPFGTYRYGRVGKAAPDTEVKLADDGEILLAGPHIFKGYWNNPVKTAETIVDGWLHTGDIGEIDEDGWVSITDRKKDIIITAGGKNITPSEIENELKFSPYIQDAVVIGDKRPYLVCLIMIDYETVAKFAQDENVPYTDFRSLTRTDEVLRLIQGEIDRVNTKFARVEQVKKFRILDHEITAEDDELTATGKLKRKYVEETYKDLIDEMYNEG